MPMPDAMMLMAAAAAMSCHAAYAAPTQYRGASVRRCAARGYARERARRARA